MKYRSEEDKSYGVAGMALGLSMFEAGHLFAGVTIEADGLDCVKFTPEFFFAGNPRVPATASWKHIVANYRISVGLVLANTICRKMVLDRGHVDRKLRKQLLDAACEQGKESCQLEKDEVEALFDKDFANLVNVFSNNEVRTAMEAMAKQLEEKRSMSKFDIEEMLEDFNLM